MRLLMVAVGVLVFALVVTDAVAAARRPGRARSPVRITTCSQDPATLRVVARGVGSAPFSIAFSDAAGDAQSEPVSVSGPFTVWSASAFPRGPVHCALANVNAPGDL